MSRNNKAAQPTTALARAPSVETTTSSISAAAEETVTNTKSNLRVLKSARGQRAAPLMLFKQPRGAQSLAPDLFPLCRVQVSSTLALFTAAASLGQGTFTYVADPTGNATNALQVFQWSTRFVGFQQYRIVKTVWHITPLRTPFSAASGSGLITVGGYSIAWIEDNPQSGAPSQAVALASFPRARVIHNSEALHQITYTTNEPGDLNLSDINTPPTHIEGSSVVLGQHCLQLYTDDGFFGLSALPGSGTQPLLGVQAVYDIEFFGIGGN